MALWDWSTARHTMWSCIPIMVTSGFIGSGKKTVSVDKFQTDAHIAAQKPLLRIGHYTMQRDDFMITLTVNVVRPFGFACLFWSVILMISVLFDKEAFIRENKSRWKAVILSIVLFIVGVACLT